MPAFKGKAVNRAPEAPRGLPALVFLGPSAWLCGDGAWEAAAAELAAWPQPLGLLGEAGLLRRFRPQLQSALIESGLHIELLAQADGADSDEAGPQRVLEQARPRNVKSLLAFGGGRMQDLGKRAAALGGWRLASLPSSAATCAAASAVAVVNDAEGAFLRVQELAGPPQLCVVELAALRQAPPRLLAAGLADTLAKWLEWRAVEGRPEHFGAAAGWALAAQAAELCELQGAAALADPASPAFDACVEACLLASAAASCAGEAPAAAAHSLANALSKQAAGRGLLHGEAVGLGLLWQEALLKQVDRENMEGLRLRALLGGWGLPTALPPGLDLGRLLADALAEDETVHLMGMTLDESRARRALPLGG
jgi:glycerol dehydrogenase